MSPADGRLLPRTAAGRLSASGNRSGNGACETLGSPEMCIRDRFLDKAIEGLLLYAFNKGEVCTCPSRALIQADIYDEFMARCLERIATVRQGNPLDLSLIHI